MASSAKVIEDGLDSGTSPPPGAGPWRWLLAGVLLGVALALVVVDTADTPVEESAEEPEPAADEVLADEPAGRSSGIGEAVPEFPDGLVAVSQTEGDGLEQTIWPFSGTPYQRNVPVAASQIPTLVEFDTNGRRFATMRPVPDEPHDILFAGVPPSVTLVDDAVTGYSWHDSQAGRLAYTTFEAHELELWTARGDFTRPELVTRAVGIMGGVVAWGDWGFVVESIDDDSLVLMSALGEIIGTRPGTFLGSNGAGRILVLDGGLKLLNMLGAERDLGLPVDDLGEILAGAFSPDGDRFAVLGDEGLRVARLEPDEVLVEHVSVLPGVPSVVWSSNGRFVLVPGIRGIVVVDTTNAEVHSILSEAPVRGLAVLPLSADG